jgi:hemoglobin
MTETTEGANEKSFYELVGGSEFFTKLVDGFYVGVAQDEVLRPMYPEGDLSEARKHLTMFFEQYWGGPKTYQEVRGHPRLRMRHVPFVVNSDARDRWVNHMSASLAQLEIAPALRDQLWGYLVSAADSLINAE